MADESLLLQVLGAIQQDLRDVREGQMTALAGQAEIKEETIALTSEVSQMKLKQMQMNGSVTDAISAHAEHLAWHAKQDAALAAQRAFRDGAASERARYLRYALAMVRWVVSTEGAVKVGLAVLAALNIWQAAGKPGS
jgi:hypothetical protein